MSDAPKLMLLSLNVGMPRVIGTRRREEVISGINKLPVESASVTVTATGIVGDGQGDLVAHGGVDKAVYAYPSEHLPIWSAEHRKSECYGAGAFGENLTVAGLDESSVYIGDRWQWGDVVLEVCQPRYPCYKLGMKLDRPRVVREMVENGRTGWYLRVLQPGDAPAGGMLNLVDRSANAVSVAMAHQARLPAADRDMIERVLAEPRLANKLRNSLEEALAESLT